MYLYLLCLATTAETRDRRLRQEREDPDTCYPLSSQYNTRNQIWFNHGITVENKNDRNGNLNMKHSGET
ncbi:hypothetical protein DPEC_G00124260 [Dallia pectoralis]|uniref:Uncharacterized protein n=1 Tax=Dallia pectoralis TaxID=75939 RepID=A0ACC2GR77_DALPE|nr:hypothetical protein DPEC_G00124260 [Dallia pectoralis]